MISAYWEAELLMFKLVKKITIKERENESGFTYSSRAPCSSIYHNAWYGAVT
jgi:hypothetical protein